MDKQIVSYYSEIKKNKLLMHLRNIIISKRSQTLKSIYTLIPFIWNSRTGKTKVKKIQLVGLGQKVGEIGKRHEWTFSEMKMFYILIGVVVTWYIDIKTHQTGLFISLHVSYTSLKLIKMYWVNFNLKWLSRILLCMKIIWYFSLVNVLDQIMVEIGVS